MARKPLVRARLTGFGSFLGGGIDVSGRECAWMAMTAGRTAARMEAWSLLGTADRWVKRSVLAGHGCDPRPGPTRTGPGRGWWVRGFVDGSVGMGWVRVGILGTPVHG